MLEWLHQKLLRHMLGMTSARGVAVPRSISVILSEALRFSASPEFLSGKSRIQKSFAYTKENDMSIVREKILDKIRMTIYSPHCTVFKLDVRSKVGGFSNP